MQKVIVILYSDSDWHKDTPFSKEGVETKRSFEDWYVRGEQYGIKFYRASVEWFDFEKKAFTKAWTFEDNAWIKVTDPVKPHALFDKTRGKDDYRYFEMKMSLFSIAPILNHPLFRIITNNKLSQYMLLGEHMPKTILANNSEELSSAIDTIPGTKIVIKPLHGSGGFGIYIGEKSHALDADIEYPVIAQEFVESTKGIPGFSQNDEVADLRLVYTDHKLVYALSRIAKEGSLFTNFHQGARAVLVPNDKIPEEVFSMSEKIIQKLSAFPHTNYSLDFIFDNDGKVLLVEINTTPGFDLLRIVGTEQIKKLNFELFTYSINKMLK